MNDLFLEISHFGDVHFTGKDVAYIISLLVTLLTAWFKLKHDNERQNEKIGSLENKLVGCFSESKEESMNARNSRIAIRKDFENKLKDVQKELKENRESFANEIKDMNFAINEVKTDTSEIKGMLNILINKNK